jgi:hypothetical protein
MREHFEFDPGQKSRTEIAIAAMSKSQLCHRNDARREIDRMTTRQSTHGASQ